MNTALLTRYLLGVLAAAGLVIDAVVHFELAGNYPYQPSGTVSQQTLFVIEAIIALVAALWVLARPGFLSAAFAVLVAGGGLALLLVYRYVSVGKIGPLTDMSEPYWYGKKISCVIGQALTVVAGLVLVVRSRSGSSSVADGTGTAGAHA